MTILARYSGTCPDCGERLQPGDLIRSGDCTERGVPTMWGHAACPQSVEKAEGAVCDRCFLRRSLTGECGCDE